MIMRGSGSGRLSWRALVGVGVLGLLALPAWSLGGGDSPKPEAPSAAPAAAPPTTVAEPAPANKTPAAGNQHAPAFGAGFVDIGTVAANPPDANDRDKKIQELEAKIKELQDELVVLHARHVDGRPYVHRFTHGRTGAHRATPVWRHRQLRSNCRAGAA